MTVIDRRPRRGIVERLDVHGKRVIAGALSILLGGPGRRRRHLTGAEAGDDAMAKDRLGRRRLEACGV